MKTRAALIFEYNVLPVYLDDNTKIDNVLSNFDTVALMDILNAKNNNEFTIVMVGLDLITNEVSIFSEVFVSDTQQHKIWNVTDFTAGEQTTINNFISLL